MVADDGKTATHNPDESPPRDTSVWWVIHPSSFLHHFSACTIGEAESAGIVEGICEDRILMLMQSTKALDPAIQDKIGQLFSRAWRRVQQRTGRSWEKKRTRWLQLLGADGNDVTSNQLRVAMNNLVSFAQLPPADTTLLRAAIHEDFRTMQKLAIESLGRT